MGTVGDTQVRVSPLSPRLSRQSPASEGEEEELLMEEEEEEVLAGVSAEDKGRRPPAKGPSEPAHPGERRGAGGGARGAGQAGLRRGGGQGQSWPQVSGWRPSPAA